MHWFKFCKRCETWDSIGLYSVSECTRDLLMQKMGVNGSVHIMCQRIRQETQKKSVKKIAQCKRAFSVKLERLRNSKQNLYLMLIYF